MMVFIKVSSIIKIQPPKPPDLCHDSLFEFPQELKSDTLNPPTPFPWPNQLKD